MRSFKALAAAVALASAAPVGAAVAQTATPVVVFDSTRVLAQSTAGQDMRTKLQAIRTQVSGELEPEAKAVQAEEQAIAQALNGLSAEQAQQRLQQDAALRQRVEAFEKRRQAFALRQAQQQELMRLTEGQALQAFDRALSPVVQGVMNARGAQVVLDRSNVTFVQPAADITQDVLARLNQEVTTVAVNRVTLEQAQQAIQAAQQAQGQQQGQQARPAQQQQQQQQQSGGQRRNRN